MPKDYFYLANPSSDTPFSHLDLASTIITILMTTKHSYDYCLSDSDSEQHNSKNSKY